MDYKDLSKINGNGIDVLKWLDVYYTKEDMEEDFLTDIDFFIKDYIMWNGTEFFEKNLKKYGVEGFVNSDIWKDTWLSFLEKFCKDNFYFEVGNKYFIPLDHNDPVVIEVWNDLGNKVAKNVFEDFCHSISCKEESKDVGDESKNSFMESA